MSAIAPGVLAGLEDFAGQVHREICLLWELPLGRRGKWRAMAGHGNFCWGHLPEIDMYVKKGIIQVEISSELRVGEINDSKW